MQNDYQKRIELLKVHHEELLSKKNIPIEWGNGIYEKYANPILTAEHTPLEWRYDFNEKDNPYLMQRIMMNATRNSGAIKWQGKYVLVRMDGFMECSVPNATMTPNQATFLRQQQQPALHVQKI